MKKLIFCILIVVFSVFSGLSNEFSLNLDKIFNSNLSSEEINVLLSGEVLIKNTKKTEKAALLPLNETADEIINDITNLKPSYLAEIIQIVPVKGNSNILSKIEKVMTDIPSYKGIPYYSERNDVWADLYSNAQIDSMESDGILKKINASFHMKPFGDFSSVITVEEGSDYLKYSNFNTTDIFYDNIKCIKKENMKSYIYAFKVDDFWILYGIGGVKAPKIPLVSDRVELSFMNRIKTFCNFVYKNIK